MSPVCSKKSGAPGIALILSIASFRVPVTSWFAALLKPMWLSLICTKLKDDAGAVLLSAAVAAKSFEVGTPPETVQSRPVPTQAMQLKKFRRSMPSETGEDALDGPSGDPESCMRLRACIFFMG